VGKQGRMVIPSDLGKHQGIDVRTELVARFEGEPLRKALLQPRVALFIADDVGLGKTIEAGLILREMLMRQKIKRVVISCPPSVVRQWQEEMESRFGFIFQVFDRNYVATKRRERGYGINPWKTHTRFIISHVLLREEAYLASCVVARVTRIERRVGVSEGAVIGPLCVVGEESKISGGIDSTGSYTPSSAEKTSSPREPLPITSASFEPTRTDNIPSEVVEEEELPF